MTCKELQEEELEVLRSIYDGDEKFKETSQTSFQYMIGEKGDQRSFLVEISWEEHYPDVKPSFSMDAFYNKHVSDDVKKTIIEKLQEEADLQLGTPMTYTLLEWAKEKVDLLMEGQPEKILFTEDSVSTEDTQLSFSQETSTSSASKKEKKPKLTKQQKRRLADKLDNKGERPRGWNWVDVVKHLSQSGSKDS